MTNVDKLIGRDEAAEFLRTMRESIGDSYPDFWHPSPPDGHVAIEGDFDHLSKRFDLATRAVVDYQPPRPDNDHEWDTITDPARPRWRKRRDIVEREQRRITNLAKIAELESKQHRRVRELLEANDPRLQEISAEIEQLRAEL